MQISASALAAEALKHTMPAASFSRSTESHNQDKVSMGPIAVRDLERILELSECVAAIVTLAVCQAHDLRCRDTATTAAAGTAATASDTDAGNGTPQRASRKRSHAQATAGDTAAANGHSPHDASVAIRTAALVAAVRAKVPFVAADRRQDVDIDAVLAMYRAGALPLGDVECTMNGRPVRLPPAPRGSC